MATAESEAANHLLKEEIAAALDCIIADATELKTLNAEIPFEDLAEVEEIRAEVSAMLGSHRENFVKGIPHG